MRSCWNLRLSSFIFLAVFPFLALAQFAETDEHSHAGGGTSGYLFPINPGQPNFLSGTMGELRNTHFHGGIDIRTNNRIGVPVLATQDGYISRTNVSTGGYGTVVYITHPDGNVSVYGHLDKYRGRLAQWIRAEQYRRKNFEVDLNFKATDFPVSKGDTIGLSGNTGSSQGPHLHFEIREGNFVLNPLKFGFDEIKDNIAPGAQRIALRTLGINSRINDRFGRFEFSLLRKSPSEFVLPVPILTHGRIGIELLADDRMDNSPGRCGINYIEMFVDSQKVFSQTIERVDLEETRAILAVLDFKTMEIKGKRFNKLYIDDGNKLGFYKAENEGVIMVDGKDHAVRISLKDESGNESNIRLRLKSSPLSTEMVLPSKKIVPLESDLIENTLIVSSSCGTSEELTIFEKGKARTLEASYTGGPQRIYLIDLRKSLPDSIKSCSDTLNYHFTDMVPSETEYKYYSDLVDIRFPEKALYDTLFLSVNHNIENQRETFYIGQRTIPLHRNVTMVLKPQLPMAPRRNLSVYRREGRGYAYLGGEWTNGKVKVSTQELGEFTFLTDSVPPSLTRIKCDNYSARFRTMDNLSGIAYYEASINGEWLLMNYDFKSGILQSDKLDPKKPLKGDFELKVVDRAGNERIFRQKIK